MRFILPIILILLTACAGVPKTSEDVSKSIVVETDPFNGKTNISTRYYSGSGSAWGGDSPLSVKYRAIYNGRDLSFIQLYFSFRPYSWYFINSAIGEGGEKLDFVEISHDVDNGYVDEQFGVTISLEKLKEISNKDWRIKFYGKNGDKESIIPMMMSLAFLNKIECYSANSCN